MLVTEIRGMAETRGGLGPSLARLNRFPYC
jgi:hypothetical protein